MPTAHGQIDIQLATARESACNYTEIVGWPHRQNNRS